MADPKNFFVRALEFTLAKEGGFVDRSDDSGGATNYGITQDTLAKWRGGLVTVADVKALQKAEVSAIYFDYYWRKIGGEGLTQYPIAAVMFDAGVLFGTGISSVYAQQAVQKYDPTILNDGHIGPKSTAALNLFNPWAFINAFHDLLLARVEKIVTDNPKNEVFKEGWQNRINAYLTLTDEAPDGIV